MILCANTREMIRQGVNEFLASSEQNFTNRNFWVRENRTSFTSRVAFSHALQICEYHRRMNSVLLCNICIFIVVEKAP